MTEYPPYEDLEGMACDRCGEIIAYSIEEPLEPIYCQACMITIGALQGYPSGKENSK